MKQSYHVPFGDIHLPLSVDDGGRRWTPLRFYCCELGLSFSKCLNFIEQDGGAWEEKAQRVDGSMSLCLPVDNLQGFLVTVPLKSVNPSKHGLLYRLRGGAVSALRGFEVASPPEAPKTETTEEGEPPMQQDVKHQKSESGLMTMDFHGDELTMVEHKGEPYVGMRNVAEGMGLDWSAQRKKLSETDRWTVAVIATVAQDGKNRDLICIPLRKLAGWLMTIQTTRIKPDLREKIELYQNECDDALWAYWTKGRATNPRMESTLDPLLVMREKRMVLAAINRAVKDPWKRHEAAHRACPEWIPAPTPGHRPLFGE